MIIVVEKNKYFKEIKVLLNEMGDNLNHLPVRGLPVRVRTQTGNAQAERQTRNKSNLPLTLSYSS
jgi:hypothetical protein